MHLPANRFTTAIALVTIATLFTTSIVVADEVQGDGDGAVPVASSTLFLDGNPSLAGQQPVCVGQTYTDTWLVAIQRAFAVPDDGSNDIRSYDNNATVSISFQATADDSAEMTESITDSTILLPSNWLAQPLNTMSTDPSIATANPSAEVSVMVTPTGTGLKNQNVFIRGVGKRQRDANNLTKNHTLKINWTAVSCNTAPLAPGQPAATPASPNQGGFTLNWTASTDDGNPNPPGAITYELQGQDADDLAFGTVASGISTNSYAFASGAPAEGTWTYRVRASDSALTSDWSASSAPVVVDRTAPTFGTCPAGGPYTLGSNGGSQSVGPIGATDGNLPDGSPGSGLDAGASTLSGTVDTTSVGSKSVNFTAVDNAGNSDTKSCSYSVIYNFQGFFRPVDNLPTLNVAKAGSAIPVKFSLTGDQGLNIFAVGSPSSVRINCDSTPTLDTVEETVTAGGSSLSYNATTDTYNYVWKTQKSWAGTCRQLTVELIDGTQHMANFKFK